MSAPDVNFSDFDVLAFDVYGTLVDWDKGLSTALQPLLAKYPAIRSGEHKWTDHDALQAFESVERDLQVREPGLLYPVLLARSHAVLEERIRALLGLDNTAATVDSGVGASASGSGESSAQGQSDEEGQGEDAHTKFGASIPNWPLFPDTYDALQRLAKHYKLCVLSNVDRHSFAYTHVKLAENTTSTPSDDLLATYAPPSEEERTKGGLWLPREKDGSKSPFTLLLTAQDVGSYKPALKGFERTLEVIDIHPSLKNGNGKAVKDRVLWVSCSLYADVDATHQLGVRSAFIDRGGFARGKEEQGSQKKYTWRFESAGELADAVEKELNV